MQIVNPNDNGNVSGYGAGRQLSDARRRDQHITRKLAHAREADLHEAKLTASNRAQVASAAKDLADAIRSPHSGVTRAQVEEEQRADERRLAGWKAAPPLPGSPHADEPDLIRYRMAVRARALEQVMGLELGNLTSPTGGYRKPVTNTPPAKPWRAGSGFASSGAKAGGPISRHR